MAEVLGTPAPRAVSTDVGGAAFVPVVIVSAALRAAGVLTGEHTRSTVHVLVAAAVKPVAVQVLPVDVVRPAQPATAKLSHFTVHCEKHAGRAYCMSQMSNPAALPQSYAESPTQGVAAFGKRNTCEEDGYVTLIAPPPGSFQT
jgi:hypothetical protein